MKFNLSIENKINYKTSLFYNIIKFNYQYLKFFIYIFNI